MVNKFLTKQEIRQLKQGEMIRGYYEDGTYTDGAFLEIEKFYGELSVYATWDDDPPDDYCGFDLSTAKIIRLSGYQSPLWKVLNGEEL